MGKELDFKNLSEDAAGQMKELLEVENNIDIHTISEDDLEKCGNLSMNQIAALEFMIEVI